jgi:hypothetical protein
MATKKQGADLSKLISLCHLLTVSGMSEENKTILNILVNRELKKEENNG